MITVTICDDHRIVRLGLKSLINSFEGIKVIDDVADGEALMDALHKHQPKVLILDVSLPGRSGLEILKNVRIAYHKVRVLVLSMYPADQMAVRLIKAGANGYLNKNTSPEELKEAIEAVAINRQHFTDEISDLLLRDVKVNPEGRTPHEMLSDREYEVMLLMGQGMAQKDIADKLALSAKTVNTYRIRLFRKLQIDNNAQLYRYLTEKELLPG